MSSEMINSSYYVGFEGEPELTLIYENLNDRYELRLWNGYFETLLDCMFEQVTDQSGILYEYSIYEGWYEESPWEIKNIKEAIQLFKSFDATKLTEDRVKVSKNIIATLPALASDIVTFLEQAITNGNRVFIVYE
ncbi:hypothetical protein E8L90_16430 [Brevibacillus antibioticus]|uniref:DUF1877 family protein n=1 Tax=Brevibacillus antibioticus TaxID=2570228 RepID=A0A4V5TJ70_9BACL|nr:hypothetical protein [Brevibacillus antibioticus]TKI56923.1 hypothetical protein E8L90_16430 [Brevibacillus antibioticus]